MRDTVPRTGLCRPRGVSSTVDGVASDSKGRNGHRDGESRPVALAALFALASVVDLAVMAWVQRRDDRAEPADSLVGILGLALLYLIVAGLLRLRITRPLGLGMAMGLGASALGLFAVLFGIMLLGGAMGGGVDALMLVGTVVTLATNPDARTFTLLGLFQAGLVVSATKAIRAAPRTRGRWFRLALGAAAAILGFLGVLFLEELSSPHS
jgi:hypothetical protein